MKILIKLLLWGLAIFSFTGLLSSLYWLLDLFNHFRAHALLASIILCLAAISFNRDILKLALFVLLVNVILFFLPLYSTSGIVNLKEPTKGQPYFKIVSSNVYTANENFSKTVEVLTEVKPDIIALTETDRRWIRNLSSIESLYPYSVKHPRPDNFGMVIYSKLPFKEKILKIGRYQIPLAVLEFEKFKLIVAHPVPPVSKSNMIWNKHYITKIAGISSKSNTPVILTGDLNTTIWGDAMRPLINSGFKRVNPLGVAYTWPVQLPLFAMQIDHFFARDIKEANFKVLGNIGSDHYPIQAIFRIP